ncbi:C40 family peptidase [Alicyclobacillus dauci]|uniref:NlpC/P60 family protein n=1 Tax=Alicyclobacillus dauci TaxID=1475485 RepID=A0ABY6Z7D8_9BACL|nr:NlpC/P60 family protein [Alicyclobacillus dauci]WAH38802.1 NlpC/P60 family protein [Alicyclobacillus dauci]
MRFKLLIGLSTATAAMGLSLSTVYAGTVQYTVRSGDSLYNIAQKYHTSVSSIKSLNHLTSNLIHPGQHLVVSGSSSTSSGSAKSVSYHVVAKSPPKSSTYTVKSGDTLWSISQRFGVSVSSLEKNNGLSSKSVLHVGQHLSVSGAAHTSLSSRAGMPDASLASGAQGYAVAQFAEKFNGVPYQWGGTSPSGFDCSGFVQYVYSRFGTNLPRTSYDQFGSGTSVSQSDLQPGDIVFFDTYGGGASHDGIYVGGGQFINAASRKVEIDSMSSGYWASHYIGARRI